MQTLPTDGGPIYAETELSRLVVEPWSTVSNFALLLVLAFFIDRMRRAMRYPPFLVVLLILLASSFVGGTIYHATRSSRVWLLLD
ncbi:MAG: hypothetical protein KDD44_12775, partial [Bdellovibrionales bacterium]|nr:hypothetical protein [Bdellovibrionales bacterium]